MITLDKLRKIIGKDQIASDLFSLKDKYEINTPERMAHFLSQVMHESGNFGHKEENLNYSAEGLLRTFPKYFTSVTAKQYARKPQAIANRVYASRMGNGNEKSGDGWRYRGRGYMQVTGKANYRAVWAGLGIDTVNNPDLLIQDKHALESAMWWWKSKGLNALADTPNDDKDSTIKSITRRVNGGYNGLQDRINKFNKIYAELKSPN